MRNDERSDKTHDDKGMSYVDYAGHVHLDNTEAPAAEWAAVDSQEIGHLIVGRGVYLGPWGVSSDKIFDAYAADDFLRDSSGHQLTLYFAAAVDELTLRNEGRKYGGTVESLRRSFSEQSRRYGSIAYCDGDLVMPPKELLHGMDFRGNKVRSGRNVYDLMKKNIPAFKKIREAVAYGVLANRLAGASIEPIASSYASCVNLSDGSEYPCHKFIEPLGVIPVRFYKLMPKMG